MPEHKDWFISLTPEAASGINNALIRRITLDCLTQLHDRRTDILFAKDADAKKERSIDYGLILGRKASALEIREDSGDFNISSISRAHARLNVTHKGHVYLTDLGSRHGTTILHADRASDANYKLLNGRKMSILPFAPVQLLDGDVITLGRSITTATGILEPLRLTIHFRCPQFGEPRAPNGRKSMGVVEKAWALRHFAETTNTIIGVSSKVRRYIAQTEGTRQEPVCLSDSGIEMKAEVKAEDAISVADSEDDPAFWGEAMRATQHVELVSVDGVSAGESSDQERSHAGYGVPPSILYQSELDEDLPRSRASEDAEDKVIRVTLIQSEPVVEAPIIELPVEVVPIVLERPQEDQDISAYDAASPMADAGDDPESDAARVNASSPQAVEVDQYDSADGRSLSHGSSAGDDYISDDDELHSEADEEMEDEYEDEIPSEVSWLDSPISDSLLYGSDVTSAESRISDGSVSDQSHADSLGPLQPASNVSDPSGLEAPIRSAARQPCAAVGLGDLLLETADHHGSNYVSQFEQAQAASVENGGPDVDPEHIVDDHASEADKYGDNFEGVGGRCSEDHAGDIMDSVQNLYESLFGMASDDHAPQGRTSRRNSVSSSHRRNIIRNRVLSDLPCDTDMTYAAHRPQGSVRNDNTLTGVTGAASVDVDTHPPREGLNLLIMLLIEQKHRDEAERVLGYHKPNGIQPDLFDGLLAANPSDRPILISDLVTMVRKLVRGAAEPGPNQEAYINQMKAAWRRWDMSRNSYPEIADTVERFGDSKPDESKSIKLLLRRYRSVSAPQRHIRRDSFDESSDGPITPENRKRSLESDEEQVHIVQGSSFASPSITPPPAKVAKLTLGSTPNPAPAPGPQSTLGATLKGMMLGVALGSVGTIVALMQIADQ
ncbi:hypothetical protein BD324DRAFT_611957 [Kockovaella imperatae]|uniref:FHA domain-containing protein n=1 Tax=Kockovaella imperatae TaxID=4999 RepID=A0A1Y1UU90_9TREE|nr:hypothetical protein BD324DRAFT_611957 [Kockovaella imperatae]ORX40755.1 hypothetical protein BD324DRAFT_611957 [Kockovaella imperatae]